MFSILCTAEVSKYQVKGERSHIHTVLTARILLLGSYRVILKHLVTLYGMFAIRFYSKAVAARPFLLHTLYFKTTNNEVIVYKGKLPITCYLFSF